MGIVIILTIRIKIIKKNKNEILNLDEYSEDTETRVNTRQVDN